MGKTLRPSRNNRNSLRQTPKANKWFECLTCFATCSPSTIGSIIPRAHTASSSAADNSAAGERRGLAVSVVELQDLRNSFGLASGGARGTADGDGDTPSRAHRPQPLPLALTAGIGTSWSQQHLPPHPGPDHHAGTRREHQPRVAASDEEAALVRRRRIALTPGARVAVIIGEETASVKPGAKTSAAHSQQDEVASQALKIPHVFGVVQELLPQVRKCKSGCVSPCAGVPACRCC